MTDTAYRGTGADSSEIPEDVILRVNHLVKEFPITRGVFFKKQVGAVQAVSDISFQVERGETLGLVGESGCGKSTLLRVAAGILRPTHGSAVVRGRQAPVIELGLGFEAELSGRENIFFNGALLGRSRAEMTDRLDEIVEFS